MPVMLKRVLPFVSTLIIGAVLGSFMNSAHVRTGNAVHSASGQRIVHSRTWLIIHSLPSTDYAGRYPYDWQSFSHLRVLLDANGNVSRVVPTLETYDVMPEEMIDAARKIEFTPATRDGKSISIWIDVEYKLQRAWPNDYYRLFPEIITASSEAGEPWRVIYE
jgi:hypothetical protein